MNEDVHVGAGDKHSGGAKALGREDLGTGVGTQYKIIARDPLGNIIREEVFDNLVVNEGLDYLLSVALAGGAQTATWYVGLTGSSPTPDPTDVMSSHVGWTEQQGYDEAARQTWTPGAVSGQSVDNSASKATFTITSNSTTIGGAFLVSDNTKGGTTGTLYGVGAFSGGDLTLSAGSTLEVTTTATSQAV